MLIRVSVLKIAANLLQNRAAVQDRFERFDALPCDAESGVTSRQIAHEAAAVRTLCIPTLQKSFGPPRNCFRINAGFAAASGGKSHSCVTPTTQSPRPSAYKISVADGSSEQIRIAHFPFKLLLFP